MGCACIQGRKYIINDEDIHITYRMTTQTDNREMIERVTYMFLEDVYKSVKFKLNNGI